jgi:hypothetical protein
MEVLVKKLKNTLAELNKRIGLAGKIILGAILIIFLSYFTINYVINFTLNRNEIKKIITKKIRLMFPYAYKIGQIRANIFRGVIIDNLAVSSEMDFNNGLYLIQIPETVIKISFVDLFGGEFNFSSVFFNNPVISTKTSKGEFTGRIMLGNIEKIPGISKISDLSFFVKDGELISFPSHKWRADAKRNLEGGAGFLSIPGGSRHYFRESNIHSSKKKSDTLQTRLKINGHLLFSKNDINDLFMEIDIFIIDKSKNSDEDPVNVGTIQSRGVLDLDGEETNNTQGPTSDLKKKSGKSSKKSDHGKFALNLKNELDNIPLQVAEEFLELPLSRYFQYQGDLSGKFNIDWNKALFEVTGEGKLDIDKVFEKANQNIIEDLNLKLNIEYRDLILKNRVEKFLLILENDAVRFDSLWKNINYSKKKKGDYESFFNKFEINIPKLKKFEKFLAQDYRLNGKLSSSLEITYNRKDAVPLKVDGYLKIPDFSVQDENLDKWILKKSNIDIQYKDKKLNSKIDVKAGKRIFTFESEGTIDFTWSRRKKKDGRRENRLSIVQDIKHQGTLKNIEFFSGDKYFSRLPEYYRKKIEEGDREGAIDMEFKDEVMYHRWIKNASQEFSLLVENSSYNKQKFPKVQVNGQLKTSIFKIDILTPENEKPSLESEIQINMLGNQPVLIIEAQGSSLNPLPFQNKFLFSDIKADECSFNFYSYSFGVRPVDHKNNWHYKVLYTLKNAVFENSAFQKALGLEKSKLSAFPELKSSTKLTFNEFNFKVRYNRPRGYIEQIQFKGEKYSFNGKGDFRPSQNINLYLNGIYKGGDTPKNIAIDFIISDKNKVKVKKIK